MIQVKFKSLLRFCVFLMAFVLVSCVTGGANAPLSSAPPLDIRPHNAATNPPATTSQAMASQNEAASPGYQTGSRNLEAVNTPQRTESYAPRNVKVGLLLPMSGQHKSVGDALFKAAQLAVMTYGDDNFSLKPFDTKGTGAGAAAAFDQAIIGGSEMIIGPLLAEEAKAVRGRAALQNIPVVALSNDDEAAGSRNFILGLVPETQTQQIIGYATSQGYQKIAVIAPDNRFGQRVVSAARQTARQKGAEVTQIVTYDPKIFDFRAVAQNIANYDERHKALQEYRAELKAKGTKEAKDELESIEKLDTMGEVDYDAILIADGGDRLRQIAPLLAYYDVDPNKVKYLGLSQWEDVVNAGTEPALKGGWFVAPDPNLRKSFEKDYRQGWGKTPPRLASLSYDATALAAVLARLNNGRPDFSYRTITANNGYAGIDGIFRFLPNGTAERGLAVLEARGKGARIIKSAPSNFAEPLY